MRGKCMRFYVNCVACVYYVNMLGGHEIFGSEVLAEWIDVLDTYKLV